MSPCHRYVFLVAVDTQSLADRSVEPLRKFKSLRSADSSLCHFWGSHSRMEADELSMLNKKNKLHLTQTLSTKNKLCYASNFI